MGSLTIIHNHEILFQIQRKERQYLWLGNVLEWCPMFLRFWFCTISAHIPISWCRILTHSTKKIGHHSCTFLNSQTTNYVETTSSFFKRFVRSWLSFLKIELGTYVRVGKTGSLGPWSRVMACCKVHIFWEGHKILRNLHLTFVLWSANQN